MKKVFKFISDLIYFIGLFVVAILVFVILQIATDINNPCSNFSDIQDQCEQSK